MPFNHSGAGSRPLRAMMVALTIVFGAQGAFSQTTSPEITAGELQTHIKFLASDALEGRGSGTEGNRKAAEYIVNLLKSYGVKPAGDSAGYYQPFDFVSSVKLGAGNMLKIASGKGTELVAAPDVDFRPLGFSSNSSVTAPLVFAGYGMMATDSSYSDFSGVDVSGKIIVALRYSPDGNNPHGALTPISSFRNKARFARERGAVGLILITGPNDDTDDDLVKLAFDQAFANSGIPVVSARRTFLEPLLASTGWTWKSIQDSIAARRKTVTIAFVGTEATLSTNVEKVYARTANIVGVLPGTNPALDTQYVVLGAHFDHLGMGGPGSGSLQPDTVAVHHGADDNGSGTAGLLELVQELASHRSSLQRSVVITFFSGEELGTPGSACYVNHPRFPLSQSIAMINMDMIGRLTNKKLTVYGTGTAPQWTPLLAKYNADSAFTIVPVPDGFGPSDHAQFYGKDMPVLFFFTGTHNDYHKPADTWDRINYPGEEQVVRYVDRIATDVINGEKPTFTRTASAPASGGGDARGFKVTLGIVPDYGESAEGMKIGGTRPGGPAEKGGLKSGDVITRMAGKKIMNIYDYMGLLGELKPGDKVEVEVNRAGTTMKFTVDLEKRK
jgi:aminopeptidase YwaD